MSQILDASFFTRKTETVARELLGCTLVRVCEGERLAGRIVETEAYLGVDDPAAHSFGGRKTPRVRSMYLPGGHTYVYFIYGMHFCLNAVTREEGVPEAVLIRALVPTEGFESMRRRRRTRKDSDLANGPGKICSALSIDKSFDGRLFAEVNQLFIEPGPKIKPRAITATARIGVDYAGKAAAWPLRFLIESNHL